ncbi:hypothetical protein MAPG_02295, partial [Magnaporthiopsis poae ATCC 64411]|uniref:Uncharacterized protein n=1 Tax=Magnaporthiopsis poae (strain ATCC 64411 / 73-15) TaxID=644358 RepID=A0A0C4DQZ6_MAGP6
MVQTLAAACFVSTKQARPAALVKLKAPGTVKSKRGNPRRMHVRGMDTFSLPSFSLPPLLLVRFPSLFPQSSAAVSPVLGSAQHALPRVKMHQDPLHKGKPGMTRWARMLSLALAPCCPRWNPSSNLSARHGGQLGPAFAGGENGLGNKIIKSPAEPAWDASTSIQYWSSNDCASSPHPCSGGRQKSGMMKGMAVGEFLVAQAYFFNDLLGVECLENLAGRSTRQVHCGAPVPCEAETFFLGCGKRAHDAKVENTQLVLAQKHRPFARRPWVGAGAVSEQQSAIEKQARLLRKSPKRRDSTAPTNGSDLARGLSEGAGSLQLAVDSTI